MLCASVFIPKFVNFPSGNLCRLAELMDENFDSRRCVSRSLAHTILE